jgi:hypothetical protein
MISFIYFISFTVDWVGGDGGVRFAISREIKPKSKKVPL